MKYLIGLLFAFLAFSCTNSKHKKPLGNKYAGISIEHSQRQGFQYISPAGTEYNYRYMTISITNDSVVPILIKIDLAKEHAYPCKYNNQTFDVFLLPEELTSDMNQLDHEDKFEEVKKFLDGGIKSPVTLNMVIQPTEKQVLTFGILSNTRYIDPAQIALISKGHEFQFTVHDSIMKHMAAANDPLDLSLGINFDTFPETDTLNCYLVIPCGRISYPNP